VCGPMRTPYLKTEMRLETPAEYNVLRNELLSFMILHAFSLMNLSEKSLFLPLTLNSCTIQLKSRLLIEHKLSKTHNNLNKLWNA